METTTTRIADLPLSNDINNNKAMAEQPNNYMPMNVHPNPYGNSNNPDVMAPPMNPQEGMQTQLQQNVQIRPQPPQTQYMSEEQMLELQALSHQQLPSRDIPMNPSQIIQDEQANPNYIQKKVHFDDYVNEHYEFSKKELLEFIEIGKKNNYEIVFTEKDYFRIKKYNLSQLKFMQVELIVPRMEEIKKKILNIYD